jgi:type II secretory pathway pseudopilin PulG
MPNSSKYNLTFMNALKIVFYGKGRHISHHVQLPNILMSSQTKSNRFSLIELLIVISIFMVLGSLLQPSLVRIFDKAHEQTCKANAKSMGVASLLYAEDHDTYLPIREGKGGGFIEGENFYITEISPYLGIEQQVNSPTNPDPEAWHAAAGESDQLPKVLICPAKPTQRHGFAWNHVGAGDVLEKSNFAARQRLGRYESDITDKYFDVNPAKRFLLGDNGDDLLIERNYTQFGKFIYPDNIGKRHNDSTNLFYEDGHVASVLYLELIYVNSGGYLEGKQHDSVWMGKLDD